MAPTKLDQTAKDEVVRLYAEGIASSAQLAEQFGVSISTICRILRDGSLGKKPGRKHSTDLPQEQQLNLIDMPLSAPPLLSPLPISPSEPLEDPEPLEEIESDTGASDAITEMVGEEFDDGSELEEDEDELMDEAEEENPSQLLPPFATLAILPFHELTLPEMCYLVIDRACEIVTRPLQDFKDLGQIPDRLEQSKTMPLFSNHRLARKFSNPQQRIIKMPGGLLSATKQKLLQKGISHVLLNGQVYLLDSI